MTLLVKVLNGRNWSYPN